MLVSGHSAIPCPLLLVRAGAQLGTGASDSLELVKLPVLHQELIEECLATVDSGVRVHPRLAVYGPCRIECAIECAGVGGSWLDLSHRGPTTSVDETVQRRLAHASQMEPDVLIPKDPRSTVTARKIDSRSTWVIRPLVS